MRSSGLCPTHIHLEVLFPPWEFKLPKRVGLWTDHMIIDLPDAVDDYLASLGKRTRREIRSKGRHLRDAHPDVVMQVTASTDQPKDLVDTFISWKNERFNARGEDPGLAGESFGSNVDFARARATPRASHPHPHRRQRRRRQLPLPGRHGGLCRCNRASTPSTSIPGVPEHVQEHARTRSAPDTARSVCSGARNNTNGASAPNRGERRSCPPSAGRRDRLHSLDEAWECASAQSAAQRAARVLARPARSRTAPQNAREASH